MLWHPGSHERLTETPWDAAAARDAIAAIVAEAEAAFDPETATWPAHPDDAAGGGRRPVDDRLPGRGGRRLGARAARLGT
jgi:hypothetical protein